MTENGSLPYRSFLLAGATRLRWLDEMATCLAHELNPPLAVIGMCVENALRDLRHGNAEDTVVRLNGIVFQVHRAAGIVEKLRRFARAGQPGAPPAPVSLDEMATRLAHELNPPLAIMGLSAGNALRDIRNGEAKTAVRRLKGIVVQVDRAAGIIEKLRRFACAGQPGAPPTPVPLDEAVANALALVGGALAEARITVSLALGDPAPVALGHQASLEQVLVDLLVNAADALRGRPPGAPRHIRIAAEVGPTDGMLLLTVADSGGGIPEALLPRLFEPFVSTKDDAPLGTGLGLSICHGLVTSMGGGIVARNGAAGAVFSVELPRAMAGGPT